ncbi:aldo/keto reductase [Rothia sp. L_38]|uniref:aldo/keto reductase n=1 Tax=Rothia sp. L_38 TaxID=3422315 RepID=UPI003D6C094A
MRSHLLTPTELGEFKVSPLGIGTSRLGAFWQKRPIKEGEEALNRALDLGVGLVDTADVYARGISERIVGRAVKHRDDVAVMTKVGLLKTPRGILSARKHSGRAGIQGLKAATSAATCFEPGYVEEAALACMRRQGKDELDILLLHEPTAADFERTDVVDQLNSMKERGLIRAWGASVRYQGDAVAAAEAEGLSWLQLPINLSNTAIADAVQPLSEDINVVGIAVLGDGSLLPQLTAGGLNRPKAVAAMVEGAYQHPAIDAVLLGMSRPAHVTENLAALERGVTDADIESARKILES